MSVFFEWRGQDLILNLSVVPNARQDEVVGILNGRLKVRIQAPPFDNLANDYLQKWLSKQFKVPKSYVLLEKGHQSKQKQFKIRMPKQFPDWLTQK